MVVTYENKVLIFKSNSDKNSILKFELEKNELKLVLSESIISRVSWVSYVEDRKNSKIYAFYESEMGIAHVAQLCVEDTGIGLRWVSVFTLPIGCNGDRRLSEIKISNGVIYARFENKLCRILLTFMANIFKMDDYNHKFKSVTPFMLKTGGQCNFEDIQDTEHSDKGNLFENIEYSQEHASLYNLVHFDLLIETDYTMETFAVNENLIFILSKDHTVNFYNEEEGLAFYGSYDLEYYPRINQLFHGENSLLFITELNQLYSLPNRPLNCKTLTKECCSKQPFCHYETSYYFLSSCVEKDISFKKDFNFTKCEFTAFFFKDYFYKNGTLDTKSIFLVVLTSVLLIIVCISFCMFIRFYRLKKRNKKLEENADKVLDALQEADPFIDGPHTPVDSFVPMKDFDQVGGSRKLNAAIKDLESTLGREKSPNFFNSLPRIKSQSFNANQPNRFMLTPRSHYSVSTSQSFPTKLKNEAIILPEKESYETTQLMSTGQPTWAEIEQALSDNTESKPMELFDVDKKYEELLKNQPTIVPAESKSLPRSKIRTNSTLDPLNIDARGRSNSAVRRTPQPRMGSRTRQSLTPTSKNKK